MILNMDDTLFYSRGDEANLFRALDEIKFISKVYGSGTILHLDCETDRHISDDEFLSLYSIFKRYNADCRELRKLVDYIEPGVKKYIVDKKMIWYTDIFK